MCCPCRVQDAVLQHILEQSSLEDLIEIACDEGRDLTVRFRSGKRSSVPGLQVRPAPVTCIHEGHICIVGIAVPQSIVKLHWCRQ